MYFKNSEINIKFRQIIRQILRFNSQTFHTLYNQYVNKFGNIFTEVTVSIDSFCY